MFGMINKDTWFGNTVKGREAIEGGKELPQLANHVLHNFAERSPKSVGEVAEDMGIDINHIKKACKWLEKQKYIRRNP